MAETKRAPLYTEYRIIAEHYNMSRISTRPLLYTYSTRYQTHDEAFGFVANVLHSAIAVHNNNPADPQFNFIMNENIGELFYTNIDGKTIIDARYRILPIEAFDAVTFDKHPTHYMTYKYRGYEIRENAYNNRFSVIMNNKRHVRHKLDTILNFIDECILNTES